MNQKIDQEKSKLDGTIIKSKLDSTIKKSKLINEPIEEVK